MDDINTQGAELGTFSAKVLRRHRRECYLDALQLRFIMTLQVKCSVGRALVHFNARHVVPIGENSVLCLCLLASVFELRASVCLSARVRWYLLWGPSVSGTLWVRALLEGFRLTLSREKHSTWRLISLIVFLRNGCQTDNIRKSTLSRQHYHFKVNSFTSSVATDRDQKLSVSALGVLRHVIHLPHQASGFSGFFLYPVGELE